MEIKTIIQGCKDNDRKSQERLYKEYFAVMMRMCMRYIRDRDRAVAVVNDGFMRVFKKIGQYEYRGSLEGWIRRIVFHCMSDNIKKEAKYMKFMVFEDYDAPKKESALNKLYEEDLLKLIEKLPAASADIFIMFAIQGYSHKEIAEIKNISVGTSKWHVSDSRKKLRGLILETNNYNLNAG